jgi:hypothetical protein
MLRRWKLMQDRPIQAIEASLKLGMKNDYLQEGQTKRQQRTEGTYIHALKRTLFIPMGRSITQGFLAAFAFPRITCASFEESCTVGRLPQNPGCLVWTT